MPDVAAPATGAYVEATTGARALVADPLPAYRRRALALACYATPRAVHVLREASEASLTADAVLTRINPAAHAVTFVHRQPRHAKLAGSGRDARP